MKYLNKVTSEGGVLFNFVDERAEIEEFYHDQMLPFQHVFGCMILGSKDVYNGTLFRFPFRTAVQSDREISKEIFDDQKVNDMKESFMSSAHLLPLFLQHVKKIELWEMEGKAKDPRSMKLVLSVERNTPRSFQPLEVYKDNRDSGSLPQYSATEQFSVTTKRMGMKTGPTKKVSQSETSSTRWIVASALARPGSQSWNYANSHKNDGLVPLTEVAISTKGQSMFPNLRCTGRVYCFLPLPIVINDLPCTINGCFAVPSNRRTLEDLETEDQKTWNHFLIKEVLVEAYLSLLHFLTTTMPREEAVLKESLSAYYKLWPIARLSHPVSKELRKGFLTALKSCQLPLAYIPLKQGQWLPVNQVKVLEVSFYSNVLSPIRNEAMKVLLDRGYKVAELTPDIRKSLTSESYSVVSPFTFSTYCHDVMFSNWDVDDAELRDNQLLYVLEHFKALKEEHKWLEDLLKTSPCVPCEPDGTRCLPTTLISPEGILKELYDVNEKRFPQDRFFKSTEVKKTLVDLGMSQHHLKDEDLLDRAQTIDHLPYTQAMGRSNSYIRYLTAVHFRHLLTFSTHTIGNPVLHQLQEIAFLPVQQRPKDTTIPWAGDNCNFAAPNSLYYSSFSHKMFTQGLNIAKIGTDIEDLFTLKVPIPDNVVDHLEAIISWVEELDGKCISEADAVFLDQAMPAVYSFLNKVVQPAKVYQSAIGKGPGRMTLETRLSRLCTRPCIWQRLGSEGRFLTPAQVVTSYHKTDCYPYLVKLNIENEKYLPLFEVLGVKKVFTPPSLVKVLQSIKDDMDGNPVPESLLDFIDGISYSIGQHHPKNVTTYGMDSKQSDEYTRKWDKLTFFLPNEHGVMSEANQLAYREDISDSSFFPAELSKGRTQYVHPSINKRHAKLLGVEDVLTSIMSQFEDNEFLKEEEFGQKEDLCTRLNGILSQYPCDVSIFKEFIQNAEDAKASEIAFVVDRRNEFGEKSLFADHASWRSLQKMPSLLVFNNRMFKEKDIESIKQLGIGGKGESLDKIGRFGIGFNVAYHVTDCPTFVSYGEGGQAENFCVFDPNFHFVPKARQRRQPGARYIMKNVDGRNSSEHFQDQFTPFLGDIIPTVPSAIKGCFDDYSAGWPSGFAVFRLPLTRSTNRKALETKLKEGHVMNVGYLQSLLRELKAQAPSMLMFLSHLKRISVFEISEDSQIVDPWSVAVRHTEDGARKCAEFAQNIQEMYSKICSQNGLVTIPPSPNVTYSIEVNILKPDAPVTNTGMKITQMSSFDISRMKYSGSLSMKVTGTSLNTCDPPKHWIVSKRFGISDVPVSLLYLAGGNHLFPIAGVAVPLTDQRSGEEFTGNLFTHLPLPLKSGILAHINAHFWVDQSRKHLENTGSGKTEPLKDWNKVLTQQVVSRAYLEVLLKCRELISKDDISSVQWYYSLFLTRNRLSLTLDDFSFKDVLYQLLLESEARVLLADELEPKDSGINWLALTANQKNPKKGWFFTGDEAVRKVLLSLGVQIAVKVANSVNFTANLKCHKSVLSVEKPDSKTAYSGEVTPELARTYLRTPAQHCSVRKDVIVPALVPLLQYVLSDISSPQECSKVDGLPLMLTSDNQFCPIKITAPLYREEFSSLLPNQTRYFISPLLMQDGFLGTKLTDLRLVTLVTPQFVAAHIQLVKQPVVDWSQRDCRLLVNVWNYIVYMEIFDTISLDHFSQIAIIPTNQSTVVSIRMAKSVLRERGSIQLLKKLAVPVVDFSVLSNLGLSSTSKCTDLIRPRLSVENNPDEVLGVLQTTLKQGRLQSCTGITDNIAYEFIGFVKNSSNLNSYRKTLRRLAIYKMVTGEWQPLEGYEQVYALPQERVPRDGLKNIYLSHGSLIEIQPLFKDFFDTVGVQFLSPVNFYQEVIIPNFCSLPTEAMIVHLQHLTMHSMENGYTNILKQLSRIQFIQDDRRSHRCCVSDYYDPNESLLKAFLSDDSFPPPPWLQHLHLLREIGLNITVTDNLWIQFARKVTTLPKSESEEKSQLLLASLQQRIKTVLFPDPYPIPKPVTGEDRQNLVQFLGSIADIPFVPCKYPAEVDLLFHQIKGINYSTPKLQLVCLRNSFLCEPDQTCLLCLTSANPLVVTSQLIYGYALTKDFKAKGVLVNALDMKLPTMRDVCMNLLELSSIVGKCTLSSKQSTDVTKRLQNLFTHHYEVLCSNDLSIVKAELSGEKCLFSPSDDGTTFRISKGSELVRDHKITRRPYMKYLACVPSYLRDTKYTSFLTEIGVKSNITVEHFIHLLNTLHASDEFSTDPNLEECVRAVYEDLVQFLRDPHNREDIEYASHQSCILLPDEGMALCPSHQLILNDAQWIKSRLEGSEYHFVLPPPPPPGGGDITLPECLKVKALSTLVYEELDEDAVLDRENRCEGDLRAEVTQMEGEGDDHAVVQECPYSGPFVHFLQSEEFGNGLKRLMSHSLNGKRLTGEHLDSIQEVQGLEVKCVYGIRTTLKNSSTQSIIPGSEKKDVPCYLDEGSSPKCVYVRFHPKNGGEGNVLLLQQVVRRLMRLLKRNVESAHLLSLLEACDPEKVKQTLDCLEIKPYSSQDDEDVSLLPAEKEGRGAVIEDFEYIMTCNFREDDLVKYCKADSETVVARVMKVEPQDDEREYPYPLKVHLKISSDDEAVNQMNSLLICRFLPQVEVAQLKAMYGIQGSSNPSGLSEEKSIVLELPCGDEQQLRTYISTVLETVKESYSKEQIYFSIERLLFQLHFDCVHRHKQPEMFLQAVSTFLKEIERKLDYEENKVFLDSLCAKISTMESQVQSQLQPQHEEEDSEIGSVAYSQMSSWSVPPSTQQPVRAPTNTATIGQYGTGSTFQGAPVLASAPTGHSRHRRRRGGRRTNYPIHPAPAARRGGGAYIWSGLGPSPGTGRMWPSSVVEPTPEPPPRVSMDDACVWLRDVSDTVSIVNHLCEKSRVIEVLGQDGEAERREAYQYPAAVCFYAHEIVLKCLKALFFAYCGLPGELRECSNLVELHQQLLTHEEIPQPVRDLEMYVHLVSGHGSNCCGYPSFDPPNTPNNTHSPIAAREVLRAAKAFLDGIQRLPEIQPYFSARVDLPRPQAELQDHPHSWEGSGLLVPMDPHSREYREIEGLFQSTMPSSHIEKIERIQNVFLWRRFRDCRRRLEDHLPSAGEKKLFHGTRQTNPEVIYGGDAGFDLRHSGTGMWGVGSYFAVNASYSSGYSYQKRVLSRSNPLCQMIVAKVLTGACIRLAPDHQLRFPPERTDQQEGGVAIRRRYDSVQGTTGGSEVYIIYDNAQSYPAYLITYT